jgi:geranylgeranyl pyrophosphate synthase
MTTQDITPAMDTVEQIKTTHALKPIEDSMLLVEQIMFDVVNSDVSILRDASRHILQAGGKRVRPRLVLLSYGATGGKDFQSVSSVAAAVELVHTASVVHDDINDHGVVRRGRPSINSIWGRTFALLTGDFLFTKVYELMAPYKDLNIRLADATVALVEGETLQASAVKENNFTREVYYDIIARKTAALFRAGAIMGAELNNASQSIINALAHYGYNIGLAFQIVDDILDLTGDEKQLGKTTGIDVEQGKGIASINGDGVDILDMFKERLKEGNTIAQAQAQASHLIKEAVEIIDILPETPYKQGLVNLANIVINRSS